MKVIVEVRGDLKLNPDGKQVTQLPMEVRGELVFVERILDCAGEKGAGEKGAGEKGARRDVRHYDSATASFKVGETIRNRELREDRRLLVSYFDGRHARLFSPAGPLARSELELVETPASSTLLDALMPGTQVTPGDSWQHSDTLVAEFFGLDVIHKNELQSTLRKVDGKLAVVDMKGRVSGAVAGVSSDLEVEAVYNFELSAGRVSWFAASLREDRAIGHAEPGFSVTTRVRVASRSIPTPRTVSDEVLAKHSFKGGDAAELLEFKSQPGGFRILHDRLWQVMVDRHDVAIMRRVDGGDLIAQCNISSLKDLKPGQHVQLEAFQADVQRALGERFGEFAEASQSTTPAGDRMLTVVALGSVSEVPIQWNYYHFSDDHGRQLSMVFTMGAQLVERFSMSDAVIVDSFRFRDREASAAPAGERRAARSEAAAY